MLRSIAITLFLLLAPPILAQCPDGKCTPAAPLQGWVRSAAYPAWLYYYQAGTCKGAYNPATDEYQTYSPATRTWGAAKAPPWGAGKVKPLNFGIDEKKMGTGQPTNGDPKKKGDTDQAGLPWPRPIQNFGVETGKMEPHAGNHYLLNGYPVSRATALKAVGGELADDSGKLRLTVIGPDADRKRVVDDLASAPALAPFRDKLLVQAYPPDHWAVKGMGFRTDGAPTVYLQAPDGRVLHRQDDYADGPGGLAASLVRKADPLYDPKKDPDGRKSPDKSGVPGNLPMPLVIGGAVVCGVLLPSSKKKTGQPALATVQAPVQAPAPAQAVAPVPSQPDMRFTLGSLFQAEMAQRRREEEEATRIASERAAGQKAFREWAGIDTPAPAAAPNA